MGLMKRQLLMLVIYHCCWVSEMSDNRLTMNGITFGEIWTYFPDLERTVTNMEVDPYHPEYLIYTNYCAIRVLDMNSFRSHLIAGNSEDCDYKEGIGSEARFNNVYGFKTLNSTHIIIADTQNNCLRLLDRLSNSTSTYAGSCTNMARRNGLLLEARFDYPVDLLRKPNTSTFFVWEDGAIREIDTNEEQVSTFMYLDYFPVYIAIDDLIENIYISYGTGLAKISIDTKDETAIISSYEEDFRDGSFDIVKFRSINQFIFLNSDTIMAVDWGNHRIRIIDLANSLVTSICNGEESFSRDANTANCRIPYPEALVLLPDQSTILISASQRIRGINISRTLQSNYSNMPSIPEPLASRPPGTQPPLMKVSETFLSQTPQPATSTSLTVQSPVWVIALSVPVSVIAVLVVTAIVVVLYVRRRCCRVCYPGESSSSKDADAATLASKIAVLLKQGGGSQDDQSVYDYVYPNEPIDLEGYTIPLENEITPEVPTSARPLRSGDTATTVSAGREHEPSENYYSYARIPKESPTECPIASACIYKHDAKDDTSGYVEVISYSRGVEESLKNSNNNVTAPVVPNTTTHSSDQEDEHLSEKSATS